MNSKTITGTYGSGKHPCEIFIDLDDGWYTAEDSMNVNQTDPNSLIDGVHIEELIDFNTFTWKEPINNLEEFEKAVAF